MYVRFVVGTRDDQSGRRKGLFYAAYDLANAGGLSAEELAALDDIHEWFAKNLTEPTRASWSARPHAKGQALSWFKESAVAHVSKMRTLQSVLKEHGVFADVLRTARPGYVVYEDDHQVLAYPFADTPT